MDTSNSQIFGGSQEECHSSESGWTMYIGSPVNEDNDDGDQVENDYVEDEYKGGGDVESDDSMVSDASSAMAANMHNMYQKQVKEDDEDVDLKQISRKVVKKVEKNANQGKKKDMESAGMNVAPAQSGNKVRRNWLGRKKWTHLFDFIIFSRFIIFLFNYFI
ncbi:hypothetical protein DCAR_0313101 [Daucus carota subsp. sativus]|uniref:Uncharacterized protein n=1 Tax=Daucus carota subsp. sativus TaxID=79200 RepID=A0AAF0WQB5_DAUCS|nr:PREDICTED: uncharacterized protein LOC108213898 [Daucus carota subsp. sativus]WOG93814.1 hypothetical protein DCAR_0313101 [Daucus carota subsp. sativus]